MSSSRRLLLLGGLAGILAVVAAYRWVPRKYDDKPTAVEPVGALLLREMPRQVLALASERAGVTYIDHTISPRLAGAMSLTTVTSEWRAGDPFRIHVKVANQPHGEFQTPLAYGPGQMIAYETVAATLAPLIDSGVIADAVRSAKTPLTNASPTAAKSGANDVEAMLCRVNYFDAFHAARIAHAAIIDEGESPTRLSELARAYANLGESCRPLLSAHFDAFFARALLYAERLVSTRPTEADSYWTRAYVRAIVGLSSVDADVAKARSLGSSEPVWASALDDFARYDTIALFHRSTSKVVTPIDPTPLAAHFATRTVALGGLDSVAIHFAELSLGKDPSDFYAMMIANDNSGVGHLHETTAANPIEINRAFAAMDAWPDLPADVRKAVAAARAARFDSRSRLALWAALDAEPADRNLLPWSALAELARETTVILAQRQLHFVADALGSDASEDLNEWWPVVKDHPAAELLATYARDIDASQLNPLTKFDLHCSVNPFFAVGTQTSYRRDPIASGILETRSNRFDFTPYEMEEDLWVYRYNTGRAFWSDIARRLFEASPNDSVALAAMVRDNWNEISNREGDLVKRAANAPHLGWRLGEHALAAGDPDKAIGLLNGVVQIAPSAVVYETIADAYRTKGDTEGLVRTLETYIRSGEDFGLDMARAEVNIGQEILLTGDAARALPYSKAGAGSGAAWATLALADNEARLGHYAEARQLFAENIGRYGEDGEYDLAFAGLIDPNLADPAATNWLRARLAEYASASSTDSAKRRYATYCIVEGKFDAAVPVLQLEKGSDGAIGLTTLAAVHLLRGDSVQALAVLDKIDAVDPSSANAAAHLAAAKSARAILVAKKALTLDQAAAVVRNAASDNSRSTAAALVGLACEAVGDPSAARAWYQYAVRCTGVGPGRVIAVQKLRKMGVEPLS